MSESLRVITVDNYDYNIIVNALNDKRLELVSKGESSGSEIKCVKTFGCE